jgi:hypothetical protein
MGWVLLLVGLIAELFWPIMAIITLIFVVRLFRRRAY